MVMLRIYFCVFCFGLLGCKERNVIQSNRNMSVQIDTINLKNSEQFYCGDTIYEDRLFFKKMKDISYFKNLRTGEFQKREVSIGKKKKYDSVKKIFYHSFIFEVEPYSTERSFNNVYFTENSLIRFHDNNKGFKFFVFDDKLSHDNEIKLFKKYYDFECKDTIYAFKYSFSFESHVDPESYDGLNEIWASRERGILKVVYRDENKDLWEGKYSPVNIEIKKDYSLKAEHVKTLKDSANYLNHYYNQSFNLKDSLSEVLFFKMLPDNFKDLKKLYGFKKTNNDTVFGSLHTNYRHIWSDDFFKNVSREVYIEKLVNISINGRWQSGSINCFKTNIWILLEPDLKVFLRILNKKTKKEIMSFWVFYFDGPLLKHPVSMRKYKRIITKLEEIDPKMIPLVEQAYAFVKEDWDDHGH